MIQPDLIPWKSKEEWIAVYNDAYSGKFDETIKAVETLSRWCKYMEWQCRPGMDFTRGILHVSVKDKYVFPDTKKPSELHDLQLMYSAEIMRFLNLVNDGAGKKNKKISLYGRAKQLDIPDWVVNIRHQMAHGNVLPHIDALRFAADYILNWLKIRYWEEEKNEMTVFTIENIEPVIKETLATLLNIYVLLKEQNILGFNTIRDIQDPDVKDLIYGINRFSLHEVMLRCRPWELKEGKVEKCVNLQKLNEYTISRTIFLVLRMIKQFLYPEKMYGVNTINILAERLIDDSVQHNGMRIFVWNSFLKAMHSWLKFPVLIKTLTDKSYENTGERAYQAGIWNVEICKALQKRFKVEYLQNTMIDETITGKFSNNKKKTKFINLDSNERKEFMKLLLKKNLNLIGQSDNKILACIFHRVEQKNPNLQHVLRLQDPIFPNHWEVLELIEHVALKPTDFSEPCLHALYNMMKWPLSSKSLTHLIKLGKLYKGEGVTPHKVKRVYKSFKLTENQKTFNKGISIREQFYDLYNVLDSKILSSGANNTQEESNELLNADEDEIVKYYEKSEWVTVDVVSNPVAFFDF